MTLFSQIYVKYTIFFFLEIIMLVLVIVLYTDKHSLIINSNKKMEVSPKSKIQAQQAVNIVSAEYNKNIEELLRRGKAHRFQRQRSADPVRTHLFIICEENQLGLSGNERRVRTERDAKSQHTRKKGQKGEIQTQRRNQGKKRSFTGSYSVQLPPVARKFDASPSSQTDKGHRKQISNSVPISNPRTVVRQNKSMIASYKNNDLGLQPSLANNRRYSTLNWDDRTLRRLEKNAVMRSGNASKFRLTALEAGNGKGEKGNMVEWREIDLLKLETQFVRLKRVKKDSVVSHTSRTENQKDRSLLKHPVPIQAKIPDFIKNYKVINQAINIDALVKLQNFGVIFQQGLFIYFGELKKGVKNGLGVYCCENFRYEGAFKNDSKTSGYEITANGYYNGKFDNNKRDGVGQYIWFNGQSYSGQWRDGVKSGSGIWKSGKGDSYIGSWVNGKVEGQGVHMHASGQRYEGQFREFLKHGKGMETFPNGDIYDGQYKTGSPHGNGRYNWKNGLTFQGHFSNGYREGKGTLTAKNYLKYVGSFKEDLPDGQGSLFMESGDHYIGSFKKGQKHGQGTLKLTKDQKILTGLWQNNKFIFNQ